MSAEIAGVKEVWSRGTHRL